MSEPDDLLLDVSEEAAKRLRAVSIDIGHGRIRTLYDLILGWSAHVRKLREEITTNLVKNPDAWNEHDFIAALFIRDFVETGLKLVEESDNIAVELVSRTDSEYRSFTQGGYKAVLSRVGDVDSSQRGWWWDRVPVSGPILERLNRNDK